MILDLFICNVHTIVLFSATKQIYIFNFDFYYIYKIYIKKKDWIEDIPSAVKGHRKFIEWLVEYVNPKTIVELGVDYGYSTFVFSNALPYGLNNKGL